MSAEINDVQKQWFLTDGARALGQMGFGPGRRVLDYGCGPGRFTVPLSRVLAPSGCILAVDRNPESLSQLEHRLELHGCKEIVRCLQARTLSDVPEDTSRDLDAILAFDVLQHVEDWSGFFDQAAERLGPGGKLWIYPAAVPHPGKVNIEKVGRELSRRGLDQLETHRIALAHADHMVTDVVYAFASAPADRPRG
jgi:cyclopropane fatty-acyl-phospholipid synthase-like methyltransferase